MTARPLPDAEPRIPQKVCKVDGCGKTRMAKGWCEAHWKRWRAHGDPLGGGTGKGEPLAFINAALLTETEECVTWPFCRTEKGYGQIYFAGRPRIASRLICKMAHGEPPTPEHVAAHYCGSGHLGCINPKHLRWASRIENEADKLLHGTESRGARNGRARLTEDDVREIRRLRGNMSIRKIGKMFGVCSANIFSIHLGNSWGWLDQGNGGKRL